MVCVSLALLAAGFGIAKLAGKKNVLMCSLQIEHLYLFQAPSAKTLRMYLAELMGYGTWF